MLGDTTASGPDLSAMENHAGRPEVAEALREGEGFNERLSSTTRERQMYVAVRIVEGGATLGVARASLSLARVERRVAELRRALGLGLLAILHLIDPSPLTSARLAIARALPFSESTPERLQRWIC